MACAAVDSVTAKWTPDHASVVCEWTDTGTNRTAYYVGLEGEPFGPAKPEDMRLDKVDVGKRSYTFAGVGMWFGKVLRCWVVAQCKDCTQSPPVDSGNLPVE